MASPVVELDSATMRYGSRAVWSNLDVSIAPGEFLAVLGPNGAGKTTLLRVLLGLERLSSGDVRIAGHLPERGSPLIGYIPQQRNFDREVPIRGRDLVEFGLNGHRPGLPIPTRDARRRVDAAIASVGATAYANAPIGLLSGGEQQRLRIAQALLGEPIVLLCDEPLLSLDLAHQRAITGLIDERRRSANSAVLFVTHEINPVLPYVDRVLYLVDGRFAVGSTTEILTSACLSELYQTPVDVMTVNGRVLVVSGEGELISGPDGQHHHHESHSVGQAHQ